MREYLTADKRRLKQEEFNELVVLCYDPDVHDGFEKSNFIEEELKEPLKAINLNPKIFTLWSTRKKGVDGKTSYLLVWFSQEIEHKITEELLPYLERKFNTDSEMCTCEVNPSLNNGFAHLAYFDVTFYSNDEASHTNFWNELVQQLSTL